ncbi:hypothetical protein T492DRAFT_867414 [Pavlovales sp. CCMP2436]|nr:hypothetical protein T492DRAFT_867414 [Pavlovales sp. CCMP2436]
MHYEDWREAGSEAACKSAGKYMMKGKEYIVEDGDIWGPTASPIGPASELRPAS